MRDRLVELLKKADKYASGVCTDYDEAQEVCAEYLLSEGVIVPPLWVGQTVYHYNHYLRGVFAYLIENVGIGSLGKSGIYWGFEANCHYDETDELHNKLDFDLDYIGKTVFLTREEAEKAIAERSEK